MTPEQLVADWLALAGNPETRLVEMLTACLILAGGVRALALLVMPPRTH
jgi:hypothetical protein